MSKQPEKTPVSRRSESLRKSTITVPDAQNSPETLVQKPAPTDAETDIQRLTLPVDPKTGQLKWDRLRSPEKTRAALQTLMNDPKLAQPAADSPQDAATNAMICNMLYDAISMVAIVAARSRGYSKDSAELLRYTAEEKAAFTGPTMKVLEKYNLLGGKYADEIMLLCVVGGVTGAHVMAMNAAHAAAHPTPAAVVPINQPEVAS